MPSKSIFIIAEIGQAHDGSLGIAHSFIDALSDTGVDAVKWQTHVADAESSSQEPFRVNFSYEDSSRMDYWRRMEFTNKQWLGLREHCDKVGLEFISSPFSLAAVDILEEIEVSRYKIGSGEVNNFLLLDKVAKTGRPIILSSGMSSFKEINESLEFLSNYKSDISLLQCTTSYPTNPKNWGLNVIKELERRYNLPVGFSDHSGDIFACLAAAAIGASILEFHVVFDKKMFGPDSNSSITMDQVKSLVAGVRQIEEANRHPIDKSDNAAFNDLKTIFEKSLSINRDMIEREEITLSCLEAKKPKGFGIDANQFEEVIGKRLNKDLEKWSFLNWEDLTS